MELLILVIVLLLNRTGYRYNRESVYKYQQDNKQMEQAIASINLRLKNATDYLNESSRTGNEEYLIFAIEERQKAEEMIKEFKERYKV